MKSRHLLLFTALFILVGVLIYLFNVRSHQTELAVNQKALLAEDEPLVWLGPGFYYGEFFALESDYQNWQKANIPYAPQTQENQKEQHKG